MSVAETSVENAMEFDIFGGTKITVDSESKDTGGGELAKGSALNKMSRKQTFNGGRGDDAGRNLGGGANRTQARNPEK